MCQHPKDTLVPEPTATLPNDLPLLHSGMSLYSKDTRYPLPIAT
jgi:hypothetical protein